MKTQHWEISFRRATGKNYLEIEKVLWNYTLQLRKMNIFYPASSFRI
jgi:hypothetical protein